MPSSLATQNKVQVGPRRAPKARAMGLQVIATRCIWVTAFSRIEMSGSYRFPEFSRHAVRICQMQSAKSNLTEGPAPFSLLSGSWNMTPLRWFSGADRWLARTHQDVLGCAVQSILDTERMSCLNCRFMGLRCRKNNRLCRKLLHCWLNLNVATLRLTRQTQRLAEHVCKTIWNKTTLMGFSLDCLSNKSRSEAFVYTLPLKARQYLMGYAFFGPHSISFGPGPGPAPRSAAPLSLWHMGFPAFPFSTLLDFYFSHLFRPFSVTQGPNLVSTWVLGAPYNNSFGTFVFPPLPHNNFLHSFGFMSGYPVPLNNFLHSSCFNI